MLTSPLAGACLTCLACLLAPCAVISGGNSHPKINTDDLSKIDAQFSSTCFPGKGCEVVTSATKGQTHTHLTVTPTMPRNGCLSGHLQQSWHSRRSLAQRWFHGQTADVRIFPDLADLQDTNRECKSTTINIP